jgi:hypothetical protein
VFSYSAAITARKGAMSQAHFSFFTTASWARKRLCTALDDSEIRAVMVAAVGD